MSRGKKIQDNLITVRMPSELRMKLSSQALQEGVSRTDILRRAAEQYIAQAPNNLLLQASKNQ
jgi:predicted DNA-binding protein